MNKAGGMNKKAISITMDTVMRLAFTAMVILFLVWFFAQVISSGPSPKERFNAFIEAGEKANDNEPLIRTLYIRDLYVYGFNAGTNYLALEQGTVKKPEEPACSAGACLCLCSKGCEQKENTYCRGIEGINEFLAKSSFGGANQGAKRGENYLVAINGDKAHIISISAERSKATMIFSEIGTTEK